MVEINENTKIWKGFNSFHKEPSNSRPEMITVINGNTEYCLYSKNIHNLEMTKFFKNKKSEEILITDYCYTKENSAFKFNDLYVKAKCFKHQIEISRTQFLNELIFILDQITKNDLVITEIIMKNTSVIFNVYYILDKWILINTLETKQIKSK